MKQLGTLKVLAIVATLGTISSPSKAISSFQLKCPSEFSGVVVEIASAETPFLNSRSLEKVRVRFEVTDVLRGDIPKEKELIVLKDGPVKFETLKSYKVSLNNDLLCNVKEI
jgi:hypothetical protein